MPDAQTIIEELLNQHTPVAFRAGGPSMNPTIRDGEPVRIRPLQAGDLRPGAIVLYRKNARLVLHRLIRRDPKTESFYIVADAATNGGEWVAQADILGVAEWVQRGERIRRLDGTSRRMAGLAHHVLRPLRRALSYFRPANHAQTPVDRP
jgi:hypothetical protein